MSNESDSVDNPPPNFYLSVFARPEIKDVCYNSQKLVLDGYTYIGCRFENCSLEVASLNFDLIRCVFDASTEIKYSAAVADISQLFDRYYPWANQHFPAFFVPLQNYDKSMTVWFVGKEF
jgi:hypothetical protein